MAIYGISFSSQMVGTERSVGPDFAERELRNRGRRKRCRLGIDRVSSGLDCSVEKIAQNLVSIIKPLKSHLLPGFERSSQIDRLEHRAQEWVPVLRKNTMRHNKTWSGKRFRSIVCRSRSAGLHKQSDGYRPLPKREPRWATKKARPEPRLFVPVWSLSVLTRPRPASAGRAGSARRRVRP